MVEQLPLTIHDYERLPIAIYICDRNDLLVDCNTAAKFLFDVVPEAGKADWYPSILKYDAYSRLINADYRPVTSEIKKNIESNKQELRFVLPDGSERWLLVSSAGIWTDQYIYDGAVHTFTDITALRQSEQQQALLAAIVQSCEDAIITKDLNGRISSWNPAAERLFGFSVKEAVGKHISLIIPTKKITEEQTIINRIKMGELVEQFETLRLSKSGRQLPVSLTISPVRDKHGNIIGASKIARDITNQKEAEQQLKNYTEHLEDIVAERTLQLDMALREEKEMGLLKSRFVSMASHEFRTPLSAIRLSASLIAKYAEPYGDKNIEKHINKVKNSVADLSAILTDFLSLEKLESGKVNTTLRSFDLTQLCREETIAMQMQTKPGQQINYRHDGPSSMVMLDDQLLKNCLNNLLSNAIKYSGENTTIELNTAINNDECLVTVQDQGIGIPEADQKHLFTAFFRAGNVDTIQGTGLGLNIVARYAGLMGGLVSFKSEPGKGSLFELHFPIMH